LVTACGQVAVRAAAEAAGIEAFMVKPVSRSTLVDALVGLFAPGEGEIARAAAGVADELPALAGARVLLAEDNEINQQIAVELLEGAGVAVDVAGTGREVLERLERAPQAYDAVLMDLQMPDMDGLEATRRLRADARFAALPIIAMTAHAMVEERERCLAAGMNDHVTKPIDPDVLFRTLARHRGRRLEADVAAPAPDERLSPTVAADLPDIDGLDIKSGLKRVAGNRKLYRRLLEQYADSQAGAGRALRDALGAGDRAHAERIAHTAQGVSGNIGAAAQQQAAAALERAIRQGTETGPLIAEFEAAMTAMARRLQDALGRASPVVEAAPPAPAPAAAKRLLGRLEALLENADGEAVDHLAEHAALFRAALGPAGFADLERAVTRYDFDTALAKLRELAAA
jgi:two-component system sensor histidine kinase/response regulator